MTGNKTNDKVVYDLLKKSGLISGNDKCPECSYAPILDWFNYCPMCTIKLSSH